MQKLTPFIILSSLVIYHLSACYGLPANTGITFLYCNYRYQDRGPREYIRLAIKKLCQGIKALPSELYTVYSKHYNNCSQPSFQELQDTFLAVIQQFNSVFFVLDALDECPPDQRKELCEFFARIVELSTGVSHGLVKLFVSSRNELDIQRSFLRRSFPTVEVEAKKVDRDIEIYVKAEIERLLDDRTLILGNTTLKDKILTALTTNASGM